MLSGLQKISPSNSGRIAFFAKIALLLFALHPLQGEIAEVLDQEDLNLIAEAYLEQPTHIVAQEKPSQIQQEAAQGIYPSQQATCPQGSNVNGYTINFESIKAIELIRFISQISNTNFIFDRNDLNFSISIVSEDPTSVENLMAALLQVLQTHGLSIVEQGNNILIYNPSNPISKVSTVVTDDNIIEACGTSVITRVFRLYNVSPEKVVTIVRPLMSRDAIVEVSTETRHLIVTDITANVDKIADLLTALDTPNAALDVAEYTVQTSFPAVLVAYAKEILSPLAQDNPMQMIAQPSSHKIFIVSTPYLINKAVQILKSLDSADITDITDLPASAMANNIFYVYKLKFQDGQEIAAAIRAIGNNLQYLSVSNVDLVNTIYSIEWIQVNNSLVITGTQESVNKVVELINALDVAPKQVYLEVLVIDTTLSNSLTFGVDWIALGNEQSKLAFGSGLLKTPPPNAPFGSLGFQQSPLFGGARDALNSPPPNAARGGQPGTGGDIPLSVGFGLGVVGNIVRHNGQSFLTLGALVNALEAEAETRIVLNPRIMAEDFQPASLFVGENIPYETTSTIIRDTGSVTQNIQYEDIGVQLSIIPTISPDNIVTLQIDQSISDRVTDINNLTPTTTKTLTSTRVHVPDGTFLVMSGHVRDVMDATRSGIPCLGTLPLIGPAFSTTTEDRTKRNLIMFVRPHVVDDIMSGIKLTNQEGYDYNWESWTGSIQECGVERAPENETYPPPECPTN